ncbi:hypothetical protein M427DRAFT_51382 [Gonapodya prolifera JEL478]|uniref:C2H2-type domain-containing protein n=1 Tax=Gonapodya prolifera (strain JEL478) TaxID=1344416 RepID=A0A139AWZ1_GONPJ|nr:hypothetical protein M427DRAFT_51382 [Gonapodya prolifera JEL478]|eukprot:KXS21103.1 hypothetical protein M427DRAFT_51382 [Gonapodya prolifera JEL478]
MFFEANPQKLAVSRASTAPVVGGSSRPNDPINVTTLTESVSSLVETFRIAQQTITDSSYEISERVRALRLIAEESSAVSEEASRLASVLEASATSRPKSPRPPLTISVKPILKRSNTVSTPQTAIPLGKAKHPAVTMVPPTTAPMQPVMRSGSAAQFEALHFAPSARYGTITCTIGDPPCGESFACSSDAVGFDSDVEEVTYLDQGNKRVDFKFCTYVEHVRERHRIQATEKDGEVAYSCPLCHFRSARDGNVYSHLLVQLHHPHVKHFYCPACKDAPSFRDKHAAARHFKDVHGRGQQGKRKRRTKHRHQEQAAPAGSVPEKESSHTRLIINPGPIPPLDDPSDSDASSNNTRPSSASYTSGDESASASSAPLSSTSDRRLSDLNARVNRVTLGEPVSSGFVGAGADPMFGLVSTGGPYVVASSTLSDPTGYHSHDQGSVFAFDEPVLADLGLYAMDMDAGVSTPTATQVPNDHNRRPRTIAGMHGMHGVRGVQVHGGHRDAGVGLGAGARYMTAGERWIGLSGLAAAAAEVEDPAMAGLGGLGEGMGSQVSSGRSDVSLPTAGVPLGDLALFGL